MSLVIGVVQKDFIVASSDSAVTAWSYDEEEAKRTGKYVATGEVRDAGVKSEKVTKLTDKVLLTHCGGFLITEIIISELKYYIEDDYDLKKCGKIAKKVMQDINKGVFKNKEYLFDVLREEYNANYLQLWEIKRDFNTYVQELLSVASKGENLITSYSMYLLGFNADRTTGLIDVRLGSYTSGPVDIKKGYPAVIEGPDGREYLQFLNLPIEERTLEVFSDRMSLIHARISKDNQVNVSSDCNYHVLIREGNNIDYKKTSIDTLEIQKTFN